MALSGSIHGSSTMQTTAEMNTLDANFGNEKYSPKFDAYMSTDIGMGQMMNYDNFYINGLYAKMNTAKTSHHVTGSGSTAIFAVCRGVGDDEGAYEKSRRIFEYLDSKRDEILKAKSLSGIKKNLRKFTVDCNDMLLRNLTAGSGGVSVVIVVYAFSGAVYMSSGSFCSLYKIKRNRTGVLLNRASDCMGLKSNHKFELNQIKYLFNSCLMLDTEELPPPGGKVGKMPVPDGEVKEKVTGFLSWIKEYIPDRNHTSIAIFEDGSKKITLSTKITAVVCAVVTVISILNIFIQGMPTA